MGYRDERKKSKFVVRVIDMDALARATLDYLIGNGYELTGRDKIVAGYPLGIVESKDGKHYVINTDGCGCGDALEDKAEEIYWYKNTIDEDGKTETIGLAPFVGIKMSKDELEKIPSTGTQTLDEFVRHAGDRVERLFCNWGKFLETGIIPEY